MFDLLDGMARNIITVNNMRYNNRNKSNGDTDEIAQIIKDVENQATQLEDMVRADGHSGFTLKGIPSIQEPSEKKKSKAKSQPTLEVDRKKQSSEEVGKSKVPETPISPKYKVVSFFNYIIMYFLVK